MSDEERVVLLDVHEPQHLEDSIKTLGLCIKRYPLETGDIAFGNILIERKSIDDFFNSLNSSRLFEQLHKMSCTGRRCYLAVIGLYPWAFKAKRVPYKVVKARLNDIERVTYQAFGIMMKVFETEEDFVKYIGTLWVRANSTTYAPVIDKKDDPQDIKRDIIARLPGIGGKLSDVLAKEYKLSVFFNLSEEEIANITVNNRKPLGAKAKKIKEVFDYEGENSK